MPLPQHNRGLGDLTSVLMPHCLVSRQFFLNESHIGQPRARSCIDAIAQLNHYVDVRLHEGEITEDFLASFQVLPGVIIHAVIRRVQELTRELVGLHDTHRLWSLPILRGSSKSRSTTACAELMAYDSFSVRRTTNEPTRGPARAIRTKASIQ